MNILENALIVDSEGKSTDQHKIVASTEWDEISLWSDKIYMPYEASPIGKARKPNSIMHAASIGRLILSRFSYGIPVHLEGFSPDAGMGMVLTTVSGAAQHSVDAGKMIDTAIGQTFIVDNSCTDYWADFDNNHLQVNITFPHQLLASLYERWHGYPANPELWQQKIKFGGPNSSWLSLLEYTCRCMREVPHEVEHGVLGKHLEEMLGIHILTQWESQCKSSNKLRKQVLAPRCVKQAEHYMRDHARSAPTLTEIAAAAGVSVRALSGAFKEFRNTTIMNYLKEQRLQGIRADLLAAPLGANVTTIAHLWGYSNLGLFAANYKQRFGEYPSETLRRLRG